MWLFVSKGTVAELLMLHACPGKIYKEKGTEFCMVHCNCTEETTHIFSVMFANTKGLKLCANDFFPFQKVQEQNE